MRPHRGDRQPHQPRELLPLAVREPHDVALVVLGVNDTLRLRGGRAWRRSLVDIIDRLRSAQRPGGRVVLAGLPDLGSFPSLPHPLRGDMALHARALDRQLPSLARSDRAVQHLSAPRIGGDGFFAEDRSHPNAAAYQQWAAHLANAVSDDWIAERR